MKPKLPMEDLIAIKTALRIGAVKVILQHENNPKLNKELTYNGTQETDEEITIILVER